MRSPRLSGIIVRIPGVAKASAAIIGLSSLPRRTERRARERMSTTG